MNFHVKSLNIGSISTLKVGRKEVESAYGKKPVATAELTETGFIGDKQADLKNHGGRDKAVCVYSYHNFKPFEEFLGHEIGMPAFGENLTIDKAGEDELFIGDIFTNGSVKLQISQPRQPCSKTGAYHGNNGVIKLMADTGLTGFYFRVLEAGRISQGDKFERVESRGDFSLSYANDIMYRRNRDEDELKNFISYPELSKAWKDELGARLK